MTTLTISLPEKLKEFIDQQVESEGFGTVSEYLRSLVREDQKRRAESRLEALLLEGIESGPAKEMTKEDWDNLRKRLRERWEAKNRTGKSA